MLCPLNHCTSNIILCSTVLLVKLSIKRYKTKLKTLHAMSNDAMALLLLLCQTITKYPEMSHFLSVWLMTQGIINNAHIRIFNTSNNKPTKS